MPPTNLSSNELCNTIPLLSGQTLHIPNLKPAFANWRQGVNPLYQQVKLTVDGRLEALITDEKVLRKAKAGDMGLFASCLLPEAAEYEVIEAAALFTVWLFFWDDFVDGSGDVAAAAEGGDGGDEAARAERYRNQSLEFVRFHLLGGAVGEGEPGALNAICGLFAEVAKRVRIVCGDDEAQRWGLFRSIEAYMDGCVVEARWRASGGLPRSVEFYGFRLHTSAVEMLLDVSKMLNRIELPTSILGSGEVKKMRTCANKISIIINEFFSLKKELKDGIPLNLLPITMQANNLDLASATTEVVTNLNHHVQNFDRSASGLRQVAVLQ